MCMQCRGSLVRLGHYYLVYHRSITCSWLCYAACDATWSEGGLDSPLLSLRAIGSCWMRRMHRMAQLQLMDRSWSEWVGISGGHSPHLQKKLTAIGKFHVTQLVVLLLLHKRGPNQHVPVSLPNLWIVMDRWPPFQTYTWRHRWCPGHITSPKGPTRVIL